MDTAGIPPHSQDDCCDEHCRWHGPRLSSRDTSPPVTLGTHIRNRTQLDTVLQAARDDAASPRMVQPFLLQAGRTLYIVAGEPNEWVVAELTFDPTSCVYTEQSRARFEWPREAFGRLLSRVYLGSDMSDHEFGRITASFERWLAQQFVAVTRNHP